MTRTLNVITEKENEVLSVKDKLSYIWDNSQFVTNLLLRKIGISDKNIELFKSEIGKNGFIDRCDTLYVHYKLNKIINEYFNKYISANDDIIKEEFEEAENKLYKEIYYDILTTLAFRSVLSPDFHKSLRNITNVTELKHNDALANDTGWKISVGMHQNKYFYTFLNLLPDFVKYKSLEDYVISKTGNSLLAKYIDDIDLEKLPNQIGHIIRVYSSVIGVAIWSILSPRYINGEQLINTDEACAVYKTINKRNNKSYDDIFNAVGSHFYGVDIEVYKEVYLDKEKNILYKHEILSGEKFRKYNITSNSQLAIISYYKRLMHKRITDSDLIFETNGELVVALNKYKINFNSNFNTLNKTNRLE